MKPTTLTLKPPVQPAKPIQDTVNRDLSLLHPIFRTAAQEVIQQMMDEYEIPFKIFEGYRSSARQTYLYAQGRTRPGKIVTRAHAWESYHQYGLAADFVLYPSEHGWTWDASAYPDAWEKLHEVGEFYGLEFLSFEQPHLQLAGLEISELKAGTYPSGGDETWWNNFTNELKSRK